MTTGIEVQIRQGEESDCEVICALIQELAEYEKKDPTKVTLEKVQKYGFGKERLFSIELAEIEGEVVGYVLYYFTFRANEMKPILYLEDLYVRPEYRRKGVAKALLEKIRGYAEAKGAPYFELNVFDWNNSAQAFYESLGGEFFPGLLTIRFS